MSDEEKKAIERLKDLISKSKVIGDIEINKQVVFKDIETILKLIEKQSKEIEELNFKYQARKDRTKQEIEELKEKLNKIYNETDNKNSQLVKALNYKLFMEDKIKAKIEELEKMNIHEFETMNVLEVLQSLLEKE